MHAFRAGRTEKVAEEFLHPDRQGRQAGPQVIADRLSMAGIGE